MKCVCLYIVLLSYSNISAQLSASWDGSFEGSILGLSATLTSQKSNTNWTGTIDVNRYLLNLQGTITHSESAGSLSDPQAGTSIPFTALLTGDQIILKIEDINPTTGLMEKMEFPFTRVAQQEGNMSSTTSSEEPADRATHDQNLLGTWRFTDSYVSGEFSFATDWFMWVNADGTFQYSDGRTAGGGSNSSIDSGDGDIHGAKWKTENKSIYLDGGNGWQFYAKYYKENNNLMLTLGNGKRQVWEKL